MVKKIGGKIHTLTVDNGSEFASHRWIQNRTGMNVYFAHPYCSYERGTNENLNGLIRQYLPKKTDFGMLNKQVVKKIEDELNHRPRKSGSAKNSVSGGLQTDGSSKVCWTW